MGKGWFYYRYVLLTTAAKKGYLALGENKTLLNNIERVVTKALDFGL